MTALEGERLAIDTSEGRPVYLLVARNGTHLRLSESSHRLLQQVAQGVSFEQLAAAMCRPGRPVSTAEVEAAHQRLVERIAAIDAGAERRTGLGWFRRRLLPAPAVAKLAAIWTFAFHPVVAAAMVVAIVGAALCVILRAPHVTAGHFATSYAVFLVSLLAHELGHASACARYGAPPSDIGVIIYFIFPSFYSDVTASWALKRWQRVVVDLGGVYFQLVFGAGCVMVYLLTGWASLHGALLLIAGSCLFSLNPILKFDGYWVVADALGVTNLAAQPGRILRHVVDRSRGRMVRALPWPSSVLALLSIYAAATAGFWAWFLWRLLPAVATQVGHYLQIAPAFLLGLLGGPEDHNPISARDFATSTFMVLFLGALIWRLIWPALVALPTKLRSLR